ncbi:hypothetical protein [Nocardia sp. CA-290969]|uniref:hypothetical protein n=1 Tax=Nocardia sp. CA-290969 TaxID=3239986 RepID=UPI003D940923
MSARVDVASTTNASDLGYLALADVAAAAADLANDEWRIIGGHMVQMLIHIYPTAIGRLRGTTDADAGVSPQIAASKHFHDRLRDRNYEDECGNRYIREHPNGELAVDILVPDTAEPGIRELGGRGFDQVPGLSLALAAPALRIAACVRLTNGTYLDFHIQVPDVEAAVVLKALAWRSRCADKDLTDLASLFEIVDAHRDDLCGWSMHRTSLMGTRLDAARALGQLLVILDRGKVSRGTLLGLPPARLAALIRKHVSRP